MKQFFRTYFALTLLCLVLSCSAQTFPEANGFINDYEQLFSQSEIILLDSIVRDYEDKTTAQIAVVTLNEKHTNSEEFDDYVLQLFNHWGVGQKDKNNGIVIAISEQFRKIRISNGFGIEEILSDEETKVIVDTIFIPHLKEGAYFKSCEEGILAIIEKLELNTRKAKN